MRQYVSVLFLFFGLADSAKIFGFFAAPSISHQYVYRSIFRELSRRGHQVTIVTTNPIGGKNPNYTEIDIHETSYREWKKAFDFAKHENTSPELTMMAFFDFFNALMDKQLSSEPVQRLINGSEKYDVVFTEYLIFPVLSAFAYHFQAPLIGLSSLNLMISGHNAIGNPVNPAFYPEMFMAYSDQKTFYERFRTTIFYIFYQYYWHFVVLPQQDALARKHFGRDLPYLGSIDKNVSLVMANTDSLFGYPTATTPNFIEIGGGYAIHLQERKPLPKDIQEYLDSAKDGVIYFSLGSNVKSSTMPEGKRGVFLEAFKQIKQKVLWKWETDDLPGKPENVKLGKWLPQADILAHPNVKAFITQGGLQSISEAIHHAIPMVVIPFFADQELNAKKLASVGVGIKLDFETITAEELLDSVKQVIENPKYKQDTIKFSALTKDQPQTPMERAVWWTEYVIRHNGAKHLRSAAVDLPWYQYLLLDVLAVLAVILLISGYVTYRVMRALLRLVIGRKKSKKD